MFIPFCKHKFGLDQFQSQLVDFAFYLAYYIGALILFIYGAFAGKDPVGRWGYKKSIVYGLLFSAIGAAVMIVTVNGNSFNGMLLGLFIVALGFSLQQTAARLILLEFSLAQHAAGVVAVDISPRAVERAVQGASEPQRGGDRHAHHRGRPLLQQVDGAGRSDHAVPDGRWAAAGVA